LSQHPEPAAADRALEPSIAQELESIPYEPLLPIEKKLIAWCLILGIVLLGVLWWASTTFFPASGPAIKG